MESPNRQAVKLLREQRKRKRRMMAFLGMALVVVAGTVMALRVNGRAMNNMVLDCSLTHELPHQHVEACYYTPEEPGAEKRLVCGMSDLVVHTHDPEVCWDKDGNLICPLQEVEEHVHTEECWEEREVLTCTLQEGEGGHVHGDECYAPDYLAEPICGQEESAGVPAVEGHTHTDECYDEEGSLTCGLEESEPVEAVEGHTHTAECYPKKLICTLSEGFGAHVHTNDCYTVERVAICGKPEVQLHTHTEECYLHTSDLLTEAQGLELLEQGIDTAQMAFAGEEEVSAQPTPLPEDRVLTADGKPIFKCGRLQVLEHVHGDDCYKAVDPEDKLASQVGAGSDGTGLPGQRTAIYEDAGIRATAVYEGEDFPENARITLERVDEDEHLREKQAELGGLLQDEELRLKALLRVNVTGEEAVELADPIQLTVEIAEPVEGKMTAAAWQDGSGAQEEGVYTQSRPELLEVAVEAEQTAVAQVEPGKIVGIGWQPSVEEPDEKAGEETDGENPGGNSAGNNTVVNISQDFTYEDEDYHMLFHVEGVARLKDGAVLEDPEAGEDENPGEDVTVPEEDESANDPDSQSQEEGASGSPEVFATSGEDNASAEDSSGADEPQQTPEPESTPAPEETAEPDENGDGEEPSPGVSTPWEGEALEQSVTVAGPSYSANILDDPEHPLALQVERVSENSETYEQYADYVQEDGGESELPSLKVMSYAFYYKGVELDMSECDVNLEVTAKDQLVALAEEIQEEQSAQAADGVEVGETTMAAIVPIEEESAEDSEGEAEEEGVYTVTVPGDSAAAETPSPMEIFNASVKPNGLVETAAAENIRTGVMNFTLMSAGKKSPKAGGSFAVTTTSEVNPQFKVQYYAWLDKVRTNGTDANLKVIDTDNGSSAKDKGKTGILPENGKTDTPNGKPLKGLDVQNGTVQKDSKLTEVYSEIDTTYLQRPNVKYFLPQGNTETFYELKQIWILQKGKNAAAGGENPSNADVQANWKVYGQEAYGGISISTNCNVALKTHFHFTNREESQTNSEENQTPEEKHIYVLLSDDDVVRLVYAPKGGSSDIDTNFYDYDISDGALTNHGQTKNVTAGKMKTASQGINSFSAEAGNTKYAFGNANTGTGLGSNEWNGQFLNSGNTGSYKGCTFGIVTGMEAGNVAFNAGISGPNLFGSGNATGRNVYDTKKENTLTFSRTGDTYTLSAAKVNNGTPLTGLETFTERYYNGYTRVAKSAHTSPFKTIYSNNFWPMDDCWNWDIHFGLDSSNQTYSGVKEPAKNDSTPSGGLPVNDDKDDGLPQYGLEATKDHNSYFGMHFSVDFELTSEYVGPLEYLFFGDDDMWVFLTPLTGTRANKSQLICDIGGVHSSVGEYVNLWDWVKDEDQVINTGYKLAIGENANDHTIAKYRMDVFYTERGASGSTCWMQYTLPSVRSSTNSLTDSDYSSLNITKKVTETVQGGDKSSETHDYDTQEEFLFKLTLKDTNSEQLRDDFRATKIGVDGTVQPITPAGNILLEKETLYSGACFTLKAGEKISIEGIPIGAAYTLEELGVYKGYEKDEGGSQINYKYEQGDHDYTPTVSSNGQELTPEKVKDENDVEHLVWTGNVTKDSANAMITFDNNFKSFQLPKTGGSGAMGLAGAGSVMVLAAGCLLRRRKKRQRR